MATFSYRARDNTGRLIQGAIEALSQEEVADKLQRMDYAPVSITEVIASLKLDRFDGVFKRIKNQDIVMFNVQFANLLSSGLTITTSLNTLKMQHEKKKMREVISGVYDSVEAGDSLSAALAKYPDVFTNLFVNMVKAAELGGDLAGVLNRYAEFSESQMAMRRKIKEALFYPVILIVAAIGVTVFMATFLIPKFVEVFNQTGIELPLSTIILHCVGTAIRKFWYLIILAIVFIAFGIKKYLKTESGKLKFDTFILKLPLLGPLCRKIFISRFARTLAALVGGGVPILEALQTVRKVVNNKVFDQTIKHVCKSVEKGISLAESLHISGEFPPDAVQMISVGEESGNLAKMLNKISDFYDRNTDYSIKQMVASLEPILLVGMGVIVAFTMAAMFFPMFDMTKMLKR